MREPPYLKRISKMLSKIFWFFTAVGGMLAFLAGIMLVFLLFGAHWLVVSDPLENADGIYILSGNPVVRCLEGAELYRQGWAPRVFVSSPDFPKGVEYLWELGISFSADVDLSKAVLLKRGVPEKVIGRIGDKVSSTLEEAIALRDHAVRAGWERVIVVSTPTHMRRAGFIFRHYFDPVGVQVVMRPTKYDPFDPGRWWLDEAAILQVLGEYAKFPMYIFKFAVGDDTPFRSEYPPLTPLDPVER